MLPSFVIRFQSGKEKRADDRCKQRERKATVPFQFIGTRIVSEEAHVRQKPASGSVASSETIRG